MRTLREAETALREFDRKRWKHAPGANTACHTTLHLAKAVVKLLGEAAMGSSDDERIDHLLFEFYETACGRIVEHALRLSRACDKSLPAVLLESQNPPPKSVKEWIELQEDIPDTQRFAQLVEGIGALLDLCERSDHGEAVDWRRALAVIPQLIRGALYAGTELLEGEARLVRPFQYRLKELKQHYEYATARA